MFGDPRTCLATKKCLNNQEAQGAICQKGENITKIEGYLIGIQWKANSSMCLTLVVNPSG
jgi:hypothetical protein